MAKPAQNCPICDQSLQELSDPRMAGKYPGFIYFECRNCGNFAVTQEVLLDGIDQSVKSKLSHYVRWCEETPRLTQSELEQIGQRPIPSILEQADNLVRHLGKFCQPGEAVIISPETHNAVMGSGNEFAGVLVMEYLLDEGLFISPEGNNKNLAGSKSNWFVRGWLSAKGHAYFDELERGHGRSTIAFMAMPFGSELIDKIYQDRFKPAIRQTGYELLRIDEKPEPGLIDNNMELAIRKAKFVIADLTKGNLGAYWEAGFAEGLGKPVIYTCERTYFDEAKTHFDTNHRQTVVWSEESIEQDMDKLKTMIRITFPGEAKLDD